jgi:hypothetical protein
MTMSVTGLFFMTFKQLILATMTLALIASVYALPSVVEVKDFLLQWLFQLGQAGLTSVL